MEHRHPVRLGHRLGARAHRAGDRVARALGEDGDGLGGGRQGAGRYQAPRSRLRTKHHGISSATPGCLRSRSKLLLPVLAYRCSPAVCCRLDHIRRRTHLRITTTGSLPPSPVGSSAAAPSGKAMGTTTSALRAGSRRVPSTAGRRAGATRLGSRLPDVPLQFEAIQNQIRSGKLPLGPGVARVERQ